MPKQLKPGAPGYETFRLAGHRFGDLQVIKRDDEKSARGVNQWQVFCTLCTWRGCFPEWKLKNDMAVCANCKTQVNFRKTGED